MKGRKGPLTIVRYRIEWLGLKFLLTLVRLMPVDVASAIMGWFWRHLAPFNRRHKRALANLQAAYPEKTLAECEEIARDMWENLGRVTAETILLDRVTSDRTRFTFDLENARRQIDGVGCVVVSMHSGNWEVTALGGIVAGHRPAGVYQSTKNPYSDREIFELRHRLYPGGLFAKSHDTARRILAIVRNRGMISFLADLRDYRGPKVPFFGRPAYATTFPATIARGNRLPLIITRVVREGGVKFRIEAKPLDYPITGDRKADVEETTRMIHRQFEEWIREYPSQWMWIHRKWV